jgi:hypothetical protein
MFAKKIAVASLLGIALSLNLAGVAGAIDPPTPTPKSCTVEVKVKTKGSCTIIVKVPHQH